MMGAVVRFAPGVSNASLAASSRLACVRRVPQRPPLTAS